MRRMLIRAPYGWEYWFQSLLFAPELMHKAFEEYLGHIAEDSRHADAWKFVCSVGCEQGYWRRGMAYASMNYCPQNTRTRMAMQSRRNNQFKFTLTLSLTPR